MMPRRPSLQYFFPWELLEMKTTRPHVRPAGSSLGMQTRTHFRESDLQEILKATG